MKSQIIIDNPCSANWDTMCKTDTGRYCAICATNVVDFTNMTLEEIENYFKNNSLEKTCGRFQKRQLVNNNLWFQFLNAIETKFSKSKFRSVVITLLSTLLFLTSCRARRHTLGTPTGNVRFLDAKADIKTEKMVSRRI